MKNFDTTPKPYFLQAMRNQSWTVTGALAELVDNSFGPGRGNASTCSITFNPRSRTLAIVDDGVGMPSIGRLFQLGNTIGRSPGDIGLYGSGGTMALLWLAEAAAVFTLRDGNVSSDRVVWSKWIDAGKFPTINESWSPATLSNTPPELLALGHGTAVVLQLADERGAIKVSNVTRDLARIYSPGIRAGKKIVWTTLGRGGETITLTDPIVMPGDGAKVVNFDFIIEYGDEELPVIGQVGLVEGITINEAGVHVGYGSRVITKTKDCFVSPDDPTQRYVGASVVGWLDLGDGWQPYLSTTKSTLNDRPLWDTLMGFVFESIQPLLEEADDEKLSLELEDIALSLQNLFDGAAIVTVPRKVAEILAPEGGGGGEVDEPKEDTPEDDDVNDESDKATEKPASATVTIEPQSDEYLEGVLCQALTAGTSITVMVNKDHPIIDIALQQRPTNRMLLNQIVVNEIANVIAADVELCLAAFKPKDARVLVDIDDPVIRERKVLRIMADGIKTAKAKAA